MLCHVDGAAGISGDMALGALLDLGVDLDALRAGLGTLGLPGWSLDAERVLEHGVTATRARVRVEDEPRPHRGLSDIGAIVGAADLPDAVRRDALRVFERLCTVEAEIHGTTVDEVVLHEAGALDAIVDVVGTCLGLHLLGVSAISASPPDVGGGSVRCRHGVLPVPAPATMALLRGLPTTSSGLAEELTTPTGAALLTTLATSWGTLPPMTVDRVGHGAGTRRLPDRPNVVRFTLGRAIEAAGRSDGSTATGRTAGSTATGGSAAHVVIEADLDDADPQVLATFAALAREAGALDVTQHAVMMKKGRVGTRLSVTCEAARREELVDLLLRHTPTIGCRWHAVERAECEREIVTVATRWGPVRVKVARWRGGTVNEKPEHDDCEAAARRHGVSVARVAAAALLAVGETAQVVEGDGDRDGPRCGERTKGSR